MRALRWTFTTLAFVLIACGGGGEKTAAPNNTGGGGGGGGGGGTGSTSNSISVGDNFFDPASTTVTVGTTVTWTFSGATQHNVTFNNSSISGSNNMQSGTFSKAFNTAGTFGYTCTIHGSAMSGTIIVQ